jgi:hypothetical protein
MNKDPHLIFNVIGAVLGLLSFLTTVLVAALGALMGLMIVGGLIVGGIAGAWIVHRLHSDTLF